MGECLATMLRVAAAERPCTHEVWVLNSFQRLWQSWSFWNLFPVNSFFVEELDGFVVPALCPLEPKSLIVCRVLLHYSLSDGTGWFLPHKLPWSVVQVCCLTIKRLQCTTNANSNIRDSDHFDSAFIPTAQTSADLSSRGNWGTQLNIRQHYPALKQ